MERLFFYKKSQSFLKRRIKEHRLLKREFKNLVFFYRNYKEFKDRSFVFSNIKANNRYRRKTFIYLQPFFVNNIFFSKLFTAKLVKRLANV
jgi:hypothetical protein